MSTRIFAADGWRVTSPYGWRTHPIHGDRRWHTGIDLVKEHKHPIPAWLPGKVLHAGWGYAGTGIGGYGYVVIIQDKFGHLNLYCHLAQVDVLKEAEVEAGQVIGLQGSTGISTASHLHFEVREEVEPSFGWKTDVNPGKYLEGKMTQQNEPAPWKVKPVDYLAQEGLLNNPERWKEHIDEPLPAWAEFLLLQRIVKRMTALEQRLEKAGRSLKGG